MSSCRKSGGRAHRARSCSARAIRPVWFEVSAWMPQAKTMRASVGKCVDSMVERGSRRSPRPRKRAAVPRRGTAIAIGRRRPALLPSSAKWCSSLALISMKPLFSVTFLFGACFAAANAGSNAAAHLEVAQALLKKYDLRLRGNDYVELIVFRKIPLTRHSCRSASNDEGHPPPAYGGRRQAQLHLPRSVGPPSGQDGRSRRASLHVFNESICFGLRYCVSKCLPHGKRALPTPIWSRPWRGLPQSN